MTSRACMWNAVTVALKASCTSCIAQHLCVHGHNNVGVMSVDIQNCEHIGNLLITCLRHWTTTCI